MAFSGSSLQRMYEVQRTFTSPLPPPHLTPSSVVTSNKTTPEDLCSEAHYNVRTTRNVNIPPPHPISSVESGHVATTPEDLCSVAHYNVRSTRNVNIPPHPTPPQNNIPHCGFEKYAFYEPCFRSAGKNMQKLSEQE